MAKTIPRIEQQKSSDRPLLRSWSLRVSRSGGHSTTLVAGSALARPDAPSGRRAGGRSRVRGDGVGRPRLEGGVGSNAARDCSGRPRLVRTMCCRPADRLLRLCDRPPRDRWPVPVRGVRLPFPAALAVVSAGFETCYRPTPPAVYQGRLRHPPPGWDGPRTRVPARSGTERAGICRVLGAAVAVCALLLYLGIGGSAPASVTLPWLAVVPGGLAAAWLTSPERVKKFDAGKDAGRLRRGFAHIVASLAVLRALVVDWRHCSWAFLGAAVYLDGDLLTFWAALQVRCPAIRGRTRSRLRDRLGADSPLPPLRRAGDRRDRVRLRPHLVRRAVRSSSSRSRRLPTLQLLARPAPDGRLSCRSHAASNGRSQVPQEAERAPMTAIGTLSLSVRRAAKCMGRDGRAAIHPTDTKALHESEISRRLRRLSASQDGDASSRSCRPRMVRQRPSPSTRP